MKKKYLFLIGIIVNCLFAINVKADSTIYEFSCGYSREIETYVIKFHVEGDTTQMIDCYLSHPTKNDEKISCNDYKFDAKGHSQKKGSDCPSSIDVDSTSKVITWITDHKGTFNHLPTQKPITDLGDSPCTSFNKKETCETSDTVACIWNKEYNFCNTDNLLYVKCGDAHDIPNRIPALVSFFVNFLKIVTPVVLIVVSVITLFKAMSSANEDEIKKAQKTLVRKIIAGVMVFLIVSIVQFVFTKISKNTDSDSLSTCLSCFLTNDCENSLYYKTNISGEYFCTPLLSKSKQSCEDFYK